jgi:hypothetical protein
MNAYWGSEGIAPRILDLCTRWRWVVSFTPRPTYPQGKSSWYPLDRRLGGPHSRSGRGGEEKNSQPLRGLKLYMQNASYEGVSKSFRTGRVEQVLQMVQLSATRGSCIGILWVSLVSFDAIILRVASQRVFIVVLLFRYDSVRKLWDTPS